MVTKDAVVPFEIKNPWKSTRWWGILVTVVGGVTTCALALHLITQEQVDLIMKNGEIIVGAIASLIGIGITLYGSFTATRPLGNILGSNAGQVVTKTVKCLILATSLSLVVGSAGGCQECPEKAIAVHTLDAGSRTMRQQWLDWSTHLGSDPVERAKLPVLTPAQQQNIKDLHADLEAAFKEFENPETIDATK